MKKASILSFQFADNFGGVLQVFALSETLKKMNLDVEIIDFRPKTLIEPYTLRLNFFDSLKIRGLRRTIREYIKRIVFFKKNYKRIQNFNAFRRDYLNLSHNEYSNSKEIINTQEKFDYYFVGSDQVWNPKFFKNTGHTYFLDYADSKGIKIAYAASIAESIEDEDKLIFERELKNFDFISVREKSGKRIISQLTDKAITVTLDPTLLLTKDEWSTLINSDNNFDRYILVYDLVKDDRIITLANIIAKELNCKIVTYSNGKGYDNWYFSFVTHNPTDFINLYKEAEFVLTSSFHGTAFALIFEKQFYTIPHPTRGSRMIDLLCSLNLEDRLINTTDLSHDNISQIDYEAVNSQLNSMKEQSIQFIKHSISSEF